MSNYTDKAVVDLFINGKPAQQQMQALEQEAVRLRKAIQSAQDAGDSKKANQLSRQLERTEKKLSRIASEGVAVRHVLDNLADTSIVGLKNALKALNREFEATRPGTERYRELQSAIGDVRERMAELRDEMQESESLWDKFKRWSFDTLPALVLIKEGYDNIVSSLRQYVDAYASMQQEEANVRKYTGMTADQVDALNEEFRKMDTRTPRDQLNKLAQDAGRLGKSAPEDVMGFVRAADKINVALDELGSDATFTLSKLAGVFGQEELLGTEKALLSVGSVINDLSQNCAASAPYIAEFSARVGGVASMAQMTVPQVMAFAAVLDSAQQPLEASATALSQVIVRIYQDPAKYARVAGMDVRKFSRLVKTDMNAALIELMQTLSRAGGMDVLSPMFADMGENGSRAIATLTTLAGKIDEVTAQQAVAAKSFREARSIDEEFNVQNNTVQAGLDKAKKSFEEVAIALGQRLLPVMSHVVSTSGAMAKVLLSVIDFILEYKGQIAILSAAVLYYVAAQKAAAIATALSSGSLKAWNMAVSLGKGVAGVFRLAIVAVTNALQYLTNGLKVNYAMQQRWRAAAAVPTNWVTAILAVAAALALMAKRYNDNIRAARAAKAEHEKWMNSLRDYSSRAQEYADAEGYRAKILYEAATNEKKSREERLESANKLIKMYPEYFKYFSAESVMAGEAASAYEDLTKKIYEAAEARAAMELLTENRKKYMELSLQRKQASDRRVKASADRDAIRRENAAVNAEAAASAESFTGAIAMQAGGSQARYEQKSTAEADKRVVEATQEMNRLTNQMHDINETEKFILSKVSSSRIVEAMGDDGTSQPESPRRKGYAGSGSGGSGSGGNQESDRLKAALEKAKAKFEGRNAQNETDYATGLKSWTDYLDRKYKVELYYFLDRKKIYKDFDMEKSEDAKKLLLEEAQFRRKHQDEVAAMNVEKAKEAMDLEIYEANLRYNDWYAKEYQNEELLQQSIFESKVRYLRKAIAFYKNGSKERIQYEKELESLLREDTLKKAKEFEEAYRKYSSDYQKKSNAEKLAAEKKLLDELLKLRLISEKDYQVALKALRKQYGGGDMSADAVMEAAWSGQMSQAEAWVNLRQIISENGDELDKFFDKIETAAPDVVKPWVSMGKAIKELVDFISDPDANPLDWPVKLGKAAAAAAAVTAAAFSQVNAYVSASADLEVAKTEKAYEAKLKAAEGNAYMTKKLEEEKEKKVAAIKRKASESEFATQIAQAIANTAANAVMAYGSMVKIPVVGPALAAAAAAMAIAAGMVQVATIKKQKEAAAIQGYASGGYTRKGPKYEPAGIVHAGEWVASQELLASPVAAPVIAALDYAQRTNTVGSLSGRDVSRSLSAPATLSGILSDGRPMAAVSAVMERVDSSVSALHSRLDEPFVTVNTVTGDMGIKRAQDEYSRIIRNKSPRSSR